jgi:hypothetical protein
LKPTDDAAYSAIADPGNGKTALAAGGSPPARPASVAPTPDGASAVAGGATGGRGRRPRRPLAWAFGVLAVLVAATGLLAGRLAAGPVPLTWALPLVLPLIDDRLAGIHLAAGRAELDWQDWQAGPRLRLAGIAASGPGFSVAADDLSAGVAAASLARGSLFPDRLAGQGIHLIMPLPAARPAGTGTADADAPAAAAGPLALLLDPPTVGPLAALRSIDLADIDVTLVDGTAGPVWRGQVLRASLDRGDAGMVGHASLALDQAGSPAAATLDVAGRSQGGADARISFEGVQPAALAPLHAALLPLGAVALPLTGTIALAIDGDGRFGPAAVAATGGPGALVIGPELVKRYRLPTTAAQRLPVAGLTLKGTIDPDDAAATISQFSLIAGDEATVSLPAPVERRLPLRRIDAALAVSPADLTVDSLAIDIGGPVISLAGSIAEPLGAARGQVTGRLTGASVATVKAYWPRDLGREAYAWVEEHLIAGRIDDARLAISIQPAEGSATVSALAVSVPVEDAVVDYLAPMPAVENGSVLVAIDLDSLRATIARASVAGLAVRDGEVVIPDINADVPTIDITFRATGPAAAVVRLLATPPLDALPADVAGRASVTGSVDARIRLAFPLLDDLELEQMRITIEALASRVAASGLPGAMTVADGNLRFAVTEQGLRARGAVVIDGIAGNVDWAEDFQATAPLATDLAFEISRATAADARRGLAPWVDLAPYLTGGGFAGRVRFTRTADGTAVVGGRLDLTQAALAVPELRWQKAAGLAASLETEITLGDGGLQAVNHAAFVASDADVQGRIRFAAGGRLDSVQVERFRLGRTEIAGSLRTVDTDGPGQGWSLNVNGPALDVEPFLADAEGEAAAAETAEAAEAAPGSLPDLFISADIDNVWLNREAPAQRVLLTVTRESGVWRLIQVKGETGDRRPFSFDIVPGNGQSRVAVRAADAGSTLQALGVLSTMRGGVLTADGRVETRSDGTLRAEGELRIRDYRLVQAPLLARLLEVMALTGLQDVLTGRGMSFSQLRVPFELDGGVLLVDDARTSGPSLGLTASGEVNFDTSQLDLRGTVVPFYWANSLIGAIPIIGNWLIGGQPGGGLISATYRVSGPFDDPRLTVNPFSLVLPSVVRMLLELIQSWAAPAVDGNGR